MAVALGLVDAALEVAADKALENMREVDVEVASLRRQVPTREAMMAQCSPPRLVLAKSAFRRLRAIGRIARSTGVRVRLEVAVAGE